MQPSLFLNCALFASLLQALVPLVAASPLQYVDKHTKAQVFTKCLVPNTVALTFDDGPYNYLMDLVNTLNKANAKGTFFFNGNNWGCIYDDALSKSLKFAYDSGHQIASHTWSHKDLTTLNENQLNDEMERVDQALHKIAGVVPAFMRPPYGNYNDLVLDVAGARGQAVVYWDFDSEDGKRAPVSKQKGLFDALVKEHPISILSLQHEVHSSSVYEVLPYAIEKLQAAGYTFVTVAECLGQAPYKSVEEPKQRDETWKCY